MLARHCLYVRKHYSLEVVLIQHLLLLKFSAIVPTQIPGEENPTDRWEVVLEEQHK